MSLKLTLSTTLAIALATSLSTNKVLAQSTNSVTPTAPGPGEVFTAGQQCSTSWDPASSSRWSNMTIQLMTGSNLDMVPLATLATGIDGTSSTQTTFTYTCPEMTLYSAVYFYQFTRGNEQDPTWTTRFTIQSPDGTTVDPPLSTTSGGVTIGYGVGALASGSSIDDGSLSGEGGSSGSNSSDHNRTSSSTATGVSSSSTPRVATMRSSSSSSSTAPTTTTSTNGTNNTNSTSQNTSGASARDPLAILSLSAALVACSAAILVLL